MDFNHQKKLNSYYKWHAPLYDATRWSFLFGRSRLMKALPDLPACPRILEVGCGTGRNLRFLANLLPEAKITGIDLSSNMLRKAIRKIGDDQQITLLQGRYGWDDFIFEPFDLIFLSYSITMMGKKISPVLEQTVCDLHDDGHIAVVDFHQTPLGWFEKWMNANHVVMDGSLLSRLQEVYQPVRATVHLAYLGIWSYFLFLGSKS